MVKFKDVMVRHFDVLVFLYNSNCCFEFYKIHMIIVGKTWCQKMNQFIYFLDGMLCTYFFMSHGTAYNIRNNYYKFFLL